MSYGNTRALRGASLDISAGEILAITGSSGSGKSTLLHCLAGIIRPDSGEVHFDDTRIDNASENVRSQLRRTAFGILFQFGQLVPELTAIENVALPLFLGGANRGRANRVALDWMQKFGVAELAASRPGEMSGGEGQRVAMARALVTDPSVVFADEPTGALDSLASEAVLGALVSVARQSGTTVVIVTHDATVAAYADREVIVRDGVLDSFEVMA
jgi:putative ABC transport system ATP-binding protein